ncbi:hypothetical protein ACFL1B_01410 [Nanoarchaeota archaeon]
MGIGKKGVLYLFVAIVFLLIVGTVFFITESYEYREAQKSIEVRIHTMNNFIEDLNNDAQKATFIAAYRALIAMEEEIAMTGNYLPDAEQLFAESFYNGTINKKNKTILNASSFSDYLERVRLTAREVGINLDITVYNVTLYHVNPWFVTVKVVFSNNVTDRIGSASWYYLEDQETTVTIMDLRDPLYSVGTSGRVPNTIRTSNLTYFINDTYDANDTTNLLKHTNQSYYIADSRAPDYLMRLEGNFTSSIYGIETIINIPALEDQDITIDNSKSILDFRYFNLNWTNVSNICHSMMNLPSWFQIDEDHLKVYEIDPKLGPESEGYQCP